MKVRISLDFEFEYDVKDADQLRRLTKAIEDAADLARSSAPDVRITKVTHRVVEA